MAAQHEVNYCPHIVIPCIGAEGFELECGPWSCLANKALTLDSYTPDFDAVGVAPLRVLRIRRSAFLAAMEATSLQPVANYQVR
jgi:hypothetical protein